MNKAFYIRDPSPVANHISDTLSLPRWKAQGAQAHVHVDNWAQQFSNASCQMWMHTRIWGPLIRSYKNIRSTCHGTGGAPCTHSTSSLRSMPKMPATTWSTAKWQGLFLQNWRIFGKKQGQSVQAAEAIKAALGRQLPVPNATRWDSLFNAVKFINEVPKGRVDATFDTLSLPRLQNEESIFIEEYCKVYFYCLFKSIRCVDCVLRFFQAMSAVAKALDILQGEQYMYMGVLQPTLCSLLRYERSLPPFKYCTPLSSVLQEGVTSRWAKSTSVSPLLVPSHRVLL